MCRQKLFFEDTEVGLFENRKGAYEKTEDIEIQVTDNRLTVRLELTDHDKYASIKALNFKRINK